jgi:DNA-binding GntR family transcriptional regulator
MPVVDTETLTVGNGKPQRQRAYERLRAAIIGGDLRPGTPLAELKLAELLSLSRTPIREALVNLSKEGLVELVPGRGAAVARVSFEDAIEIFQIREALEGMAARLGGAVIPEPEIDRLEHGFDALEATSAQGQADPGAESSIGKELHRAIIDAARNKRIASILDQMEGQIALAITLAAVVPGRLRHSVAEHREILAALRARDQSAAELAMRKHLASASAEMMRFALDPKLRQRRE